MANFTVVDVKKLRELTGSGMKACRDTLAEIGGDFDKAVEVLRIKGAKDVSKRVERTTVEGLTAVSGNTMVEVNSKTDFVAKDQELIDFANKIADAAAAVKADSPEELAAADLDGQTAADAIQELSARIGEKLELHRAATLEGDNIIVYLHRRAADLPVVIGVLIAYTDEGEGVAEAVHAAATQVVALKAQYLPREDVLADRVEAERVAYEKITREEDKPGQAVAKIVEGRLNGSYRDVVLLEQPSVADNKEIVRQPMDEAGATLTGFVRSEVGQR